MNESVCAQKVCMYVRMHVCMNVCIYVCTYIFMYIQGATGSKTLLAEWGKLPLKFTCLAGTSTCPTTLSNKGESHCEDSAQKITC